ncbi:MAG TPA: thioredoxin family protein [Jiangellales bacterium]|nr:thioredoxin family protein [Jiangellales bacterium]
MPRVEAGVEGVLVLVAALTGATVIGLWRRHADGRMTSQHARAGERLRADDLGVPLGERATFVQFSTAFCQPCRATRQVLSHLARSDRGVVHVDIDAEANLDLVRRLGVMRTPTTFVLDGSGVIRRRAAGQLRLADARAAVQDVAGS